MPKKNSKYRIMILLALAMLLSCESNIAYDRYEHTQLSGWDRNDTIHFNIPPIAKSGNYSPALGLRINPSFPFMSLTLIVERATYPRTNINTDTITCNLIDKKGKPTGQGVNLFQYLFPLKDIHLEEGDSISVTVRHDMRMETLPGVADVGIQLIKK